jgi:PqqD family protein of HPr-rel-A system
VAESAVRWRALAGSQMMWHSFDDGGVLFSAASSETHLLAHETLAVLALVVTTPRTAEDIFRAIEGGSGEEMEALTGVDDILQALYRARLVEPISDVPCQPPS